ncbi:MAG: type III secretion system chaperone [Puniceicoccales bacterium]|jgi:hypothetical protein|nr:type III secretion system chaperone [Puniceicoccales bacterium]
MDKFSLILHDFANKINLVGLKIDPSGYCCLDVDNGMLVHLKYDSKRDGMIFISEIGEVPQINRSAILRYLLRMNDNREETKGMTLSFNAESGKAALGYQYPLRFLTDAGFEEFFKLFLDEVERWMKRITTFMQGEIPEGEEASGSAASQEYSSSSSGPQFMIGA